MKRERPPFFRGEVDDGRVDLVFLLWKVVEATQFFYFRASGSLSRGKIPNHRAESHALMSQPRVTVTLGVENSARFIRNLTTTIKKS